MSEYSIIIPTTQHQIQIEDLYFEDADLQSTVQVDEEECKAPTTEYRYYIDHIGKRFFINGGWILELSNIIDVGRSFFAGAHIGHILRECHQLKIGNTFAENILWITGEVDENLNILPVEGIAQKLQISYESLLSSSEDHHIIISIPEGNKDDVPEHIKSALEEKHILFIFPNKVSDITKYLSSEASCHPASFDKPTEYKPYQGLEHYNIEDQKRFFGRSQEITEALELLKKQDDHKGKLALITGASGSGKSSFVRAGLIADLKQKYFQGKQRNQSFLYLECPKGASISDVNNFLQPLNNIISGHDKAIILMDQLEEILSQFSTDNDALKKAYQDLDHYIIQLLENKNLTLLMTLRSDCYGLLDMLPETQKYMTSVGGNYPLAAPTEASLQEIIREPIKQFTVKWEGNLYEDIITQAASLKDSLSLLSIFMNNLWESAEVKIAEEDNRQEIIYLNYQRDENTSEQRPVNQVLVESISIRANETFNTLPSEIKNNDKILQEVIFRLTTSDIEHATYHKRAYGYEDFSADAKLLIDRFTHSDARLIVKYQDQKTGHIYVQWAHEAVYRNWDKATLILNNIQDSLKIEAEFTPKAEHWKNNHKRRAFLLKGKEDNKRAQNLIKNHGTWVDTDLSEFIIKSNRDHFIKQILMGIIALILVGISAFSYYQYREYKSLKYVEQARKYETGHGGVRKDPLKVIKLYEKAAALGNLTAITNLGLGYLDDDKGIPHDYKKALYWLKKGAEEESFVSQYNLGNMYVAGAGIVKNYKKALYWYKKSADHNFSPAFNSLGAAYYHGNGVKKNYEKALYWYEKAIKANHHSSQADAWSGIGDIKLDQQDYKEAFKAYKESVASEQDNRNYSSSEYMLGHIYHYGMGVRKDYEKAIYWYEKGANRNNINALFRLGYMYYYGEGVKKNYEKALNYLETIVSTNQRSSLITHTDGYREVISYAWYSIGNLFYSENNGLKKDCKKSFKAYYEASEYGHAESQYNVGSRYATTNIFYDCSVDDIKDNKKALYWYKKAADQGHIEAQYNVGIMYNGIIGIKEDFKKAFYWYKKAADQGHAEAQHSVGLMYELGKGVKQNSEEAKRWYQSAREQGYEPPEIHTFDLDSTE